MTADLSADLLDGRTILVIEDDYFIARRVRRDLEAKGAAVLGPVSNVADALALLESAPRIDGAVLDINLRGEQAFTVADALAARRVPFVFATGYDESVVPPAHAGVPLCKKPVALPTVARALFG